MNLVQPIRDTKKIELVKKILLSKSARDHLLFVLGINSGLRISDIRKLKIKDISTDKGKPLSTYELYEQKTKKYKRFPFSKNVQKAITLYMREIGGLPDEYVFRTRETPTTGEPMTRMHAYRIINTAAKEAGITEKIGTHSLRKTFGYHAYRNGADIELIQKILNHAAPSITMRYIGITQDEMDDVIFNLNL